MKNKKRSHQNLLITLLLVLSCQFLFTQNADKKIPYLVKNENSAQLIVNEKPFLMIGGELGNSSALDINYLRTYWQDFQKMNLNTLLVPVYWELIEPQEGKYDFALLDSIILSARKHDIKLVILWFGSWKNSMSCYAPYWVKEDPDRFPRSRTKDGKPIEILTPFNNENRDTDAKAFVQLMKHIREFDGDEHTIIMIQVENEIGMIPEARDYYDEANQAFSENVPVNVIQYLKNNKKKLMPEVLELWKENGFKETGSWQEVFGKSLQTDEIFMAWHFAKYTNYITEAGKTEYPLPMYVNAALIRPDYQPGQYPSAGPLPHLFDIWRAAAPSIDFFSPDIYFPNFAEWCQKYIQSGNPLFIPEAALNKDAPANAVYAFGECKAMGFCPFSIESLRDPENAKITKIYDIIDQMSPLILDSQSKNEIRGVLLDEENQTTGIEFGNYKFNFAHDYTFKWAWREEGPWPRVGCMIIKIGPDEFYVAGSGVIVTFESLNPGKTAGIGSIDEGKFIKGKWTPGRRLNGDQSHQGRHLRIPNTDMGIQKVKLYQYQ